MVTRSGFEPETLWLKVKCSTDWANGSSMVASARFELANATVKVWCLTAWLRGKQWWREMDSNHRTRRNRFTVCRVWPLRYPSMGITVQAYFQKVVASARFELANVTFRVWCLTAWPRGNGFGEEGWNWTTFHISPSLMVPEIGIEPTTYWLQVSCSTDWAIPAKKWWAI